MDARGAPSIGCSCCSISWPCSRWLRVGGVGLAISQDYGGVLFIPFGLYALAALDSNSGRRCAPIPRHRQERLDALVVDGPRHYSFRGAHHGHVPGRFLCTDSDPGTNQYGPNPKFPERAAGVFPERGFPPMGFAAPPQPPTGESGAAFCTRCGARINGASTLCGNCGASV